MYLYFSRNYNKNVILLNVYFQFSLNNNVQVGTIYEENYCFCVVFIGNQTYLLKGHLKTKPGNFLLLQLSRSYGRWILKKSHIFFSNKDSGLNHSLVVNNILLTN
jgi:hypothetical protein